MLLSLIVTAKKKKNHTSKLNESQPNVSMISEFPLQNRRAERNDEQAIHEERSCQTQQQGQDIDNST